MSELAPLRLPTALKRGLRRCWDREPAHFRDPFGGGSFSRQELFATALELSDRMRRRQTGPMVRFYLEGQDFATQAVFPLPHLPLASDGGFEGYAARMAKEHPGQRFGLVFNDCHQTFNNWERARGLASDLSEAVGVPQGGFDTIIFIGNYRHTPFGIHKDNAHVVTFVVEGTKRFLTWPWPALAQRPEVKPQSRYDFATLQPVDAADHDAMVAAGAPLEGAAGDVLYWPESSWHRAEPSDGLSVTITLGLNTLKDVVLSAARLHEVPLTQPLAFGADAVPGASTKPLQLPASLRAAVRRAQALATSEQLQARALKSWLRFSSAGAFTEGPLPDRSLAPGKWVQLRSKQLPILWASPSPGLLLVASHGVTYELARHPRLVALLNLLNAGKQHSVEALSQRFCGRAQVAGQEVEVTEAVIVSFLKSLVQARALRTGG
jgi:hypothetical protein